MVNNALIPIGQSSQWRLREGPLNVGMAPGCPQPVCHPSASLPLVNATSFRPLGAVFRLMMQICLSSPEYSAENPDGQTLI